MTKDNTLISKDIRYINYIKCKEDKFKYYNNQKDNRFNNKFIKLEGLINLNNSNNKKIIYIKCQKIIKILIYFQN